MEMEGVAGDARRRDTRGGVTKVERNEGGNGLWMGVDTWTHHHRRNQKYV
jgi:hypothetical protein